MNNANEFCGRRLRCYIGPEVARAGRCDQGKGIIRPGAVGGFSSTPMVTRLTNDGPMRRNKPAWGRKSAGDIALAVFPHLQSVQARTWCAQKGKSAPKRSRSRNNWRSSRTVAIYPRFLLTRPGVPRLRRRWPRRTADIGTRCGGRRDARCGASDRAGRPRD